MQRRAIRGWVRTRDDNKDTKGAERARVARKELESGRERLKGGGKDWKEEDGKGAEKG